MPNPFQIEFILRQHSPILHFQHYEEGATLRASEFKPKLDRFIREELKDNFSELFQKHQNAIKTYFPDRLTELTTSPSPYWLTIWSEGQVEKLIVANTISKAERPKLEKAGIQILDKTPYFAEQEVIKNYDPQNGLTSFGKLGLMGKGTVRITIRSQYPALLSLFHDTIPYFLASTNFGCRSSKGFGSFYLDKQNRDDFEDKLQSHQHYNYERIYFLDFRGGYKSLLQKIENDYKLLKSGINKSESKLKKYYKNTFKIDWEKEKLLNNSNNSKYVRALLGLAELFDFPRKKLTFSVSNADDFDRYQSPITFKIFENTAYLLIGKIPESLYNQSFSFKEKKSNLSVTIKTPDKEQAIDLHEFIKEYLDQSWNQL